MGLRPAGSLPPKAAEIIYDKIIRGMKGNLCRHVTIGKVQNLEVCNKIKRAEMLTWNGEYFWHVLK